MSVESSLWTFRIKDASDNVLINLIKARKRSVKIGLNKAGEASFTYSMNDFFESATDIGLNLKSLIGLGRNILECLRGNEVFFAGQIINLEQRLDALDAEIEVKALGWFWLLGTRFAGLTTDKVYTNLDAGSIAADLINTTQALANGSFGITIGTIQTSVNRTLTYQRKPIKEAIEELGSADNGFDFEITPSKVFNVYFPQKGQDKTASVVFLYPGRVLDRIEELNDASELANSILSIGTGSGLQEVNAQRDDTSSQGTFKVRQKIVPVKDLNNATVLGDIGDEEINKFAQINPVYKLTMHGGEGMNALEGYTIGDTIKLKISESYWSLEQNFRVFEIHVDIDENDMEKIELIIGLI